MEWENASARGAHLLTTALSMTWMRKLTAFLALGIFVACSAVAAPITLKMADGNSVSGDVNTYTDRGLVIRMADGNFQTISWGKISIESLTELRDKARTARDREQVEPFLPFNDTGPKGLPKVLLADPERPARPAGTTGLLGMFGSGVGLFLIFLAYAASLYATYEIAFYRRLSMGIAMGGAAVLPFIAPIVFFFAPEGMFAAKRSEELEEEEDTSGLSLDLKGTSLEAHQDQIQHSETNQRRRGNTGNTSKSSKKAAPSNVPTILSVFERGKVVFNRRFFETKLGPFLKTVPGPDATGKQLVFETHRGVFVGTKVSTIEQTYLDLFVDAGNASAVERIPFIEIQSVRIESLA